VDLHELSALEIAAAYRSGDTSPSELVDHLLVRVAAHDDTVGAFVTVTEDAARAQAKAADQRLRDDADLPVLYGVPTAIKDLTMTAGVRTSFGSAVMRDFVPDVSDGVVDRLADGGLISLGKTSTPEFGAPCYTEPEGRPPARTPWDLTRSAGGSSGGAAAAVATGLVPLAHGSDGGGSIRIPASVCGLVGLKPSRGRITSAPMYGDVSGLSTHGPLATTVRDAAALLDVLAGPAPGDPAWAAPLPADESFLGWCDRDPGRLRIAVFSEPVVGRAGVDPQVLRAHDDAVATLVALGHDVEQVPAPMGPDVVPVFEVVWAVGATGWPLRPEQEQQLRPLTRWLRERGRGISAPDYNAALVAMRQAAARTLVRLHPYDAVLTPTLAQLPALVGGLRNDADPAADFEAQKDYTPFTAVWNVTGMPAVSVPTGWSDAGLPIGTMLAGRPGEEHLLLALAAQVEAQGPPRPLRAVLS
jgi:amidase